MGGGFGLKPTLLAGKVALGCNKACFISTISMHTLIAMPMDVCGVSCLCT